MRYNRDSQGLANVKPDDPNWAKVDAVAERYGRYVYRNFQIFDYHTVVHRCAGRAVQERGRRARRRGRRAPSRQADQSRGSRCMVKCETPSQFIGAARYDLYFLESEGNFSLNYFKGSVGLWFRLVIALAIAVACSTYLAGVLSFLTAMFLFIGGFFLDFIHELARGMNIGGGPLESLARLINNSTATVELDQTPTVQAIQMFDAVCRWVFRRVINVIPDVDRYGMTEYVAQGFSIGPEFLLTQPDHPGGVRAAVAGGGVLPDEGAGDRGVGLPRTAYRRERWARVLWQVHQQAAKQRKLIYLGAIGVLLVLSLVVRGTFFRIDKKQSRGGQ